MDGPLGFRTILVLVVLLTTALATGPVTAAAQERVGNAVVVAEDETVEGDLEALGRSVVIRGTVNGNVEAVGGDVFVAETGRVTGSVDAATGSLRIAGIVEGDVSAAAGSVVLAEGGTIGRDLEAGAGTVRLLGTIDGSARIGADRIVLGASAVIGGDLIYDGELVDQGGTVEGTITRESGIGTGPWLVRPALPGIGDILFAAYALLVNLLVGAILLGLAPGVSRSVVDRVQDAPVRAGAVGLGLLVAIPIVLIVVALTLIGIPLALVGAILFGLLAWIGSIYGAIAIGTWLVSLADGDSVWLGLLVGSILVAVIGQIPILGGLVTLVVFLLGFGALALVAWTAYRRRRGRTGAAGAGTAS